MGRKKIQLSTDQRPFVMVYKDFLESSVLDNYFQRLVFIYLKKFADAKNQCFPSAKTISDQSGISINKVKSTLKELEEKGILTKKNRFRADGGKSTNLYTLNDYAEIWDAGNNEEMKEIIDRIDEQKMIDALTLKGYTITKTKEKGLATAEPTKVKAETSTKLNPLDMVNNTPNSNESQDMERFSLMQIKSLFEHDLMVYDYPNRQNEIDTVMSILYDTLNTSKETIRISGEDKPSMVVIGKLMKLNKDTIMYSIDKYNEQTDRVKNPISYMLTILYRAAEQYNLDVENQVRHDMSNWNG